MPRVDLPTHFRRHRLLRLLWLKAPSTFALLKPNAQWELHELYQPSRDIGLDELELHIAGIHRTKASLLNRAGKYYRVLERVYVSLLSAGLDLEGDGRDFRRAVTRLISQRDVQSNSRGGYSPQPHLLNG